MATEKQALATTPHHSFWVSASAGTGKTKILTDRLLRLLLEGTSPHKILCLTFTKAATTEMSSRLLQALGGWSRMSDAELQQHLTSLLHMPTTPTILQKARMLFPQMTDHAEGIKIYTIHAFCQALMQQFPIESGISPHFNIMDALTKNRLIDDAMRTLCEAPTGTLQEAIYYCTTHMGYAGFQKLLHDIITHASKFDTIFSTYADEKKQSDALHHILGITKDITSNTHITALINQTPRITTLIEQTVSALTEGGKRDHEKASKLQHWLHASDAQRRATYDDYLRCFLSADYEPFKTLASKKICETYPDLIEQLEREQARLIAWHKLYLSLQTAERTEHLLTIARSFLDHYNMLKRHHALLDYDDLIAHACQLLSNPEVKDWVLYKLDGGIDHILVDEAQDTSEPQWKIIQSIADNFFTSDDTSSSSTLFVVGDEKQSIYRFQGAEPTMFREVESHYQKVANHHHYPFASITLDNSFRSSPAILCLVDHFCALPLIKQAISTMPETIHHHPHRQHAHGKVILWPLIHDQKEEDISDSQHFSPPPAKRVAQQIADQIITWFHQKTILTSQGRPIEPRDILILVRHRHIFMHYLMAILKRANIPVAGVDRTTITDHIAIQDLMALTAFLLFPDDDMNLANTLKSPLFGWDDNELYNLTYGRDTTKSLWQHLYAISDSHPLWRETTEQLQIFLQRVDFETPFYFFSYVLDIAHGRTKYLARMGDEIHDILDEFLSLTLLYEDKEAPSLQGFLHWLSMNPIEIQRDLEQDANQIRVMTAHGAKGLQAPIVFLPDTTQLPSSKEPFCWKKGEKPMVFWSSGEKSLPDRCKEIYHQTALEDEKEYIRLLYVALTRAEDELYITGWLNGTTSLNPKSWYAYLNQAMQDIGSQEDELWIVESGMKDEHVLHQSPPSPHTKCDLPVWSHTSPPEEQGKDYGTASSSSYYDPPSSLLTQKNHATNRGTIIHQLLQVLPDTLPLYRHAFAQEWLKEHGSFLSEDEQCHIITQTIEMIENPQFAHIFTSEARAEVPIIGEVAGKTIHGQIDRLLITKNHIHIIDYKTHRTPPKTYQLAPKEHILQLYYYRYLLQKIYPNHLFQTSLLWTSTPLLMPIPEAYLEEIWTEMATPSLSPLI